MSKLKNEMFVYALRDGIKVHINEFNSGVGANCGCSCPVCREAVIANVTSKSFEAGELKIRYQNHFSHQNPNSKCSGIADEKIIVSETGEDNSIYGLIWSLIVLGLIWIFKKEIKRFLFSA